MRNLVNNNQKTKSVNISVNGKSIVMDNNEVLSDLIMPCNINLLNKETITWGYILDSNGNLSSSDSVYGCSDYIKVEAGKKYSCSYFSTVCEYDENKNFIRIATYSNSSPATIPSGVFYIKIQIITGESYPSIDEFMLVQGDKLPIQYYPYGCYMINKDKIKGINVAGSVSPVNDMVIDFIGDSITLQGTFIKYMEKNYNITANKYSGNGSKLTFLARNRLAQADKNADAIIFMAGTNDVHYTLNDSNGEEMGTFEDTADTQTFAGGVHYMCQYLLENFKMKRILICSSPRRHDKINGVPTNELLDKYVSLEKQIVESYGLPFLDLFHEYAHYTETSDGIHITNNSGNLIGRVMVKSLENM